MPEIIHATRATRTQPASALDDARAVSGALALDASGMDAMRRTIDPALKPSREQAEAAVRTLLLWAGEDPARQGLLDTPKRVARSYEEHFRGYTEDPIQLLQRTFDETDGYDEMVVLKNMRFESHCEHHLAPIIGHASIAYLPSHRVIGISKLARLLDVFSKRLTLQEKMTAQIANALEQAICPRGVAVVVDAVHHCMTTRGVHKTGVSMVTSRMLGEFRDNATTRQELLSFLNNSSSGSNHR